MDPDAREIAMQQLQAALARRAEADSDLDWAEHERDVAESEDAQSRFWRADDDVRTIRNRFPECRG